MSVATGSATVTGALYEDNVRMPAIDLASSAGTASAINIMQMTTEELDMPSTSNHTHSHTHTHPHLHLQQQQQEQQQPAQSQQQEQSQNMRL